MMWALVSYALLTLICFMNRHLVKKTFLKCVARCSHSQARALERQLFHLCGIDENQDMGWREYLAGLLSLNLLSGLFFVLLLKYQTMLPASYYILAPMTWPDIFSNTVSYLSGTNWQSNPPELIFHPLTRLLGPLVQNFLAAATGFAVALAFVRGLVRRAPQGLGNVWVDVFRLCAYLLLPLCLISSLLLGGTGVMQDYGPPLEPEVAGARAPYLFNRGLVAAHVAIKQLGSNGGGYYSSNSAHPWENPNLVSNTIQLVLMLCLPVSCFMLFGHITGDRGQFRLIFKTASLVLLGTWAALWYFESQHLNPFDGLESRFNLGISSLWAAVSTLTNNGSANANLASFSPSSQLLQIVLMNTAGVFFGATGLGLVNMILMVMLALFIASLMIGRVPEYMGNKLHTLEISYLALSLLTPSLCVLVGTAFTGWYLPQELSMPGGRPHHFTELLYAFSSTANNNGQSLSGLPLTEPFYQVIFALTMLVGRFAPIIFTLLLSGRLLKQANNLGREHLLPLDSWIFLAWVLLVIFFMTAVIFVPALALGPIVEILTGGAS